MDIYLKVEGEGSTPLTWYICIHLVQVWGSGETQRATIPFSIVKEIKGLDNWPSSVSNNPHWSLTFVSYSISGPRCQPFLFVLSKIRFSQWSFKNAMVTSRSHLSGIRSGSWWYVCSSTIDIPKVIFEIPGWLLSPKIFAFFYFSLFLWTWSTAVRSWVMWKVMVRSASSNSIHHQAVGGNHLFISQMELVESSRIWQKDARRS
jgi:hypothetical protein